MTSRRRAVEGPLVQHDMDARHASLVQDYLLLENEYDGLKERLQAAKMRKAILSAEVRFMRRRLKKLKQNSSYLKENETSGIPQYDALAAHNGSGAQSSFQSLRNDPFDFDESPKRKASNDNVRLVSALKTSGFTSKADDFVTQMAGKRKISWQDQISLECN